MAISMKSQYEAEETAPGRLAKPVEFAQQEFDYEGNKIRLSAVYIEKAGTTTLEIIGLNGRLIPVISEVFVVKGGKYAGRELNGTMVYTSPQSGHARFVEALYKSINKGEKPNLKLGLEIILGKCKK